ncbi:MAG: hypothetical protein DLM55_09580 [Acidimicrobiales bacterium]|nr:MAG: hypothetical protein DLM55_09580 [Acidimicrobiales bacterium]
MPPDVEQRNLLDFVLAAGPRLAAVTRGSDPIIWQTGTGLGKVDIPTISVVDTLGSGDVLHGAFSYAIASAGSMLANV